MNNKKIILISLFTFIAILIAIFAVTKNHNYFDYIDYGYYGQEPSYSEKGEIQLENSIYYINIGETVNVKVVSANREEITWASNDESIAIVDNNGNVKGLIEGRTKVYASLSDTEYATVEVVVVDSTKTTKEEVQKEDAINSGEPIPTKTGSPKKTDEPKGDSSHNDPKQEDLSYYSTEENQDVEIPEEPKPVVVEPDPTPEPNPTPEPERTPIPGIVEVPVTNITLDKTSVTGYTLEEDKLVATINPPNSTRKLITWSSSDTSIVTVNNGLLKFKRSGTATITASVGGKSATATVTVKSKDRIHFISHGEANGSDHHTGDAILLESNGSFAMIDMGNINAADRIVNYLKANNIKALDFVLFTHMDPDHAGNLQAVLESGVKVKNIWIKDYNVPEYQKKYISNNVNGIDRGLATQDSNASTYKLNKALARYKRIIYLSEYSTLKDLVGNIKHVSNDAEGNVYTFKNLKFTMTLYNNKRNGSAIYSENFNSITSLIEVNGHKVLLTGDDYDTKKFNTTASKVGKVDVFKVQHHGSRHCSLLTKNYSGDLYNSSGTSVSSIALNKLKPSYYVVTSSKKKISNIRNEYNVTTGNMCVDKLPSNANIRYVDETSNALIVDLSENTIRFITK